MAKDRSENSIRRSTNGAGGDDDEIPNVVKRFVENLKGSSNTKQLAVGAVSGITSGYLTAKFGKLVAIAVGGSLLIIQLAQYNGYIEIDWKKVNQDVKVMTKQMNENRSRLPKVVSTVQNFVKENIVLAGGFASGFLIGLAWG